jgi:hypothetical protein
VTAGNTAMFTVSVSAIDGLSSSVTLTCSSGLPPGTSCDFVPPVVTPGAAAATSRSHFNPHDHYHRGYIASDFQRDGHRNFRNFVPRRDGLPDGESSCGDSSSTSRCGGSWSSKTRRTKRRMNCSSVPGQRRHCRGCLKQEKPLPSLVEDELPFPIPVNWHGAESGYTKVTWRWQRSLLALRAANQQFFVA